MLEPSPNEEDMIIEDGQSRDSWTIHGPIMDGSFMDHTDNYIWIIWLKEYLNDMGQCLKSRQVG